MVEGTDSAGGFLVPTTWAGEIMSAAMEKSIVRPRARVLPMTSDRINVIVAKDTTRATNVYGGVVLTWLAEGGDAAANAAAPVLANVGLNAHEAVASMWVSNQAEADIDRFGSFVTRTLGEGVGFLLDDLFIWGTGSNQPLGIMYAPAMLAIARNAGYGSLLADDFGNMAARLLPGSWQNAVWLISQSVLATMCNDATSGANANGAIDLSSMTAFGRPIIVTEKCATSATAGDIILADWSQYAIGERDLIIAASRETTYSTNTYGWFQNQTLWKVTLRVDGQPLLSAAITPRRGGSTVSPFISLTITS